MPKGVTRMKSKRTQYARDKNARVSRKISLLRSEGVPQRQAVAQALSMTGRG